MGRELPAEASLLFFILIRLFVFIRHPFPLTGFIGFRIFVLCFCTTICKGAILKGSGENCRRKQNILQCRFVSGVIRLPEVYYISFPPLRCSAAVPYAHIAVLPNMLHLFFLLPESVYRRVFVVYGRHFIRCGGADCSTWNFQNGIKSDKGKIMKI